MSDGLMQALATIVGAFIGAVVSNAITHNKYWMAGGFFAGLLVGFIVSSVLYTIPIIGPAVVNPTAVSATGASVHTQTAVANSTQTAAIANARTEVVREITQSAIGTQQALTATSASKTQESGDMIRDRQTVIPVVSTPTPTAVSTPTPRIVNLAPGSLVEASSVHPWKNGQCYAASNVIDTFVTGDGDDGDNWGNLCKEWATDRKREGASIKITLPEAMFVESIEIYDRPNSKDWITRGILKIDNDSIMVGILPNDAKKPFVVKIDREVNVIEFLVTDVGPETQNVGLAEIKIMGFKK